MKIRYDIEKIKRIITDFCVLTGLSMSFLDTERNTLFHYVKENDFCSMLQTDYENKSRCVCSDETILNRCFENKCFEGHICHAGLFDAAMPIIKNGIFVGTILMGRVRLSGEKQRSEVLYLEVPEITDQQIQSLETLLPNVLFESAIFIEFDNRISEISEYINNHLSEQLSVEVICKRFLMSKNTLYALFRENFETTVNDYITKMRLEKAKGMLLETNNPVYEIAEAVGISNDTYFCRLFKKKEGISATKYRTKQPTK
jgi:AraC-like DNA-binding protein